MSSFETTLALVGILLAALLSGLWIFAALVLASIAGLFLFADMSLLQIGSLLRATMWRSFTSWETSAVPIFIFMGQLFFAGRLSEDLFNSLLRKFRRLPGGVLQVNVWACSAFAAISGSSTATMMTIGRVTVPELKRLGYRESVAYGSLAGAGTFGILIPPSIPLIIYGILAEQSVSRLFVAGFMPGLMLALLFTVYIAFIARGERGKTIRAEPADAAQIRQMPKGNAIPTLIIGIIVFGGIYTGVVTATEAAVLGVFVTLIFCAVRGTLTYAVFAKSIRASIATSANILIIIGCAAFLSAAVGALGIPQFLIESIAEMGFSYAMLIAMLALVFLVMGMFIDGLSMMVITLPIVLPVVVAAGGDPIWFGIFLVLMIEVGLLTPPLGIHLFVIQSMTGRSLMWSTNASLPFTILLGLGTLFVAIFPEIALFLPGLMNR